MGYFQQFFKETEKITDFSYFKEINIDGELHIFEYNYTKGDILKLICGFDKTTQKKIRNKMVYIDFNNGDIMHFLNYVLNTYCDLMTDLKIKELKKEVLI